MYRDRLTLRQLWVRIRALPADSPLWLAVSAEQAKAEAAGKSREIDDALAQVQPPKG